MNQDLKSQFSQLMHEIIEKNKEIMDRGNYHNLINLCEQDITILAYLKENADLTAKEIADRLGAPKTTIVTAVSRLAKRGYLKQIQNASDKREKYVMLTEKGKKANQEHFEYETIILSALTNRWNTSDQKQLAEILARREKFE